METLCKGNSYIVFHSASLLCSQQKLAQNSQSRSQIPFFRIMASTCRRECTSKNFYISTLASGIVNCSLPVKSLDQVTGAQLLGDSTQLLSVVLGCLCINDVIWQIVPDAKCKDFFSVLSVRCITSQTGENMKTEKLWKLIFKARIRDEIKIAEINF